MKALIWHDEQLGAKFDIVEIPASYKAKAQELHTQLVEMAVEEDKKLLEAYLEAHLCADRRAAQALHPQRHDLVSTSCR